MSSAKANEFTVLTYHDIAPQPVNDLYTVSRPMFVAHMDYLKSHGYQPISLKDLQRFRNNPELMPKKAVLLTFDDGLSSYKDFVVPLLKIYGFPSVASIVSGWLDGKNLPDEYHGKLMNWQQVRELSREPLVELVSHSHDLHHGVRSNPQGSQEAASTTRQYLPVSQSYETENAFRQRLRIDLSHSVKRIKAETDIAAIGLTWPYGAYDNVGAEVAADLGLHYQFTLDAGPANLNQLPRINRIILLNSNDIGEFKREITYASLNQRQKRFAEIHLDAFLQATNEQQQESLLSAMIDQLRGLDLNTVFISPFSSDGRFAFFPNPEMPMSADVLSRVVHQLRAHLDIREVFVLLPGDVDAKNLTPLYTELARLIHFNGVVFGPEFPNKQAKFVKELLTAVQPQLIFGQYSGADTSNAAADFIVSPINTDTSFETIQRRSAELKGIPKPLYFITQQAYERNSNKLQHSQRLFQSLNIQHYGFRIDFAPLAATLRPISRADMLGKLHQSTGG
ncbi:polysaccharide deacetylase family protein [Kaarinaea lacus]